MDLTRLEPALLDFLDCDGACALMTASRGLHGLFDGGSALWRLIYLQRFGEAPPAECNDDDQDHRLAFICATRTAKIIKMHRTAERALERDIAAEGQRQRDLLRLRLQVRRLERAAEHIPRGGECPVRQSHESGSACRASGVCIVS